MYNTKFFLISFLMVLLMPLKSFGLIEVDITRGNLNPLPLAVSPLSIDENSRKSFEALLKKKKYWGRNFLNC
jgi:TolB protein